MQTHPISSNISPYVEPSICQQKDTKWSQGRESPCPQQALLTCCLSRKAGGMTGRRAESLHGRDECIKCKTWFANPSSCTFGSKLTFSKMYHGIFPRWDEFEVRCTTRRTHDCIPRCKPKATCTYTSIAARTSAASRPNLEAPPTNSRSCHYLVAT
jgi:hypothetical protein